LIQWVSRAGASQASAFSTNFEDFSTKSSSVVNGVQVATLSSPIQVDNDA
jgi:hypothetical protein